MTARIIDGRVVAQHVETTLRTEIAALRSTGVRPGLAALRIGDDPASEIYVRNKKLKAEELGLHAVERHLPADIGEAELLDEIGRLNSDDSIDGILLQLPLPAHLDSRRAIESIDPAKDVDGFHPTNAGRLHLGQPCLVPCTPSGIMELIDSTGEPIAGRHAVVIGRSHIVGRPVAALLLSRDATVTICHSGTADLPGMVAQADLVIAAIGRPFFVQAPWIRPGAIVIDVGINRLTDSAETRSLLSHDEKKLAALERRGAVIVGDVDFARASEVASWITPVPGGVGPMTIIMLMRNTVRAARERRS